MKKILIFCFITFIIYILKFDIIFAAMDSTNYQINPDVINEAGGFSQSANYKIWHNIGESPTGVSDSVNYRINAGFFTDETPALLFTISSNTVNLGTLASDQVSTSSINLNVSTNAMNGYSIKAYDNTSAGISNGMISGSKDINDATTPNSYLDIPSSGTEHFGIVVTGTHSASGYASGTKINSIDNTTWADVGSYSGFISGDILTVQYRASISATSPASTGFQTVTTYIATGNF